MLFIQNESYGMFFLCTCKFKPLSHYESVFDFWEYVQILNLVYLQPKSIPKYEPKFMQTNITELQQVG